MYLSKLAERITPYEAGEQPQNKKYIKLNTNENPYPPANGVKDVLEKFDIDGLKLYSDPDNIRLKEAIAKVYGVEKGNVFVGNGSDEVLAMCFPAFFNRDGNGVAFADITYSFYPVYADLYEIKKNIIPLNEDFSLDTEAFRNTDAEGVVIANPNAPTGIVLDKEEIESIIIANGNKVVIVDEAYADFSNESVVDLVGKYDNLIVVRTFSKSYSLAGIRCGYAIADRKLIDGLDRIKNSFNSYTVNSMSEAVAREAVLDTEYHKKCVEKVIDTRERITDELKRLGMTVLSSGANFIFAKHKEASGETLYSTLKERGILVRYFNKARISDFVRITIGSDGEMDRLIEELKVILK